jgi:hypothetical protein
MLVCMAMDARSMIGNIASIALGLLAGTLHFSSLRWNTSLYACPGRVWMGGAMHVLRMATLGGLLTLAAVQGALPLLLVTAGLLAAGPVVIRVLR